jgi:hypothetical protein
MGVTETVCFLRRTFYKLIIRELFILRESQKPTPYLYLPFRESFNAKAKEKFRIERIRRV